MNPALSLALTRLLPTQGQSRLLRACLYQGAEGREAWADVQRRGPDVVRLLRHGPPDVRRLAPLLFVALRESGAVVDGSLGTVLRTAYLREEIRSQEYRRVSGSVLSALEAARVPFIVFRGAALSELVYAHPALRHSHDLNLLVPPEQVRPTVEVLARAGCRARPERPGADAVTLDHPSGLPVLVHARMFRVAFYGLPWGTLWARAREAEIAGRQVHVLSETDTLLHACYQALHSVRVQPFGWAADAYLVLRKRGDLAWTELLESANLSRTVLPLSVALDYLARELDAPIPEAVRERLAAETADPLERDVALLASRRGGGLRVRSLLASPAPLRHRLTVLRWLVLPSRRYLEWSSGAPLRGGLARLYLERAGRYLARRAARRLRRAAPTPGTGVRGAQRSARLPAETV